MFLNYPPHRSILIFILSLGRGARLSSRPRVTQNCAFKINGRQILFPFLSFSVKSRESSKEIDLTNFDFVNFRKPSSICGQKMSSPDKRTKMRFFRILFSDFERTKHVSSNHLARRAPVRSLHFASYIIISI